jgi:hypothetical protein
VAVVYSAITTIFMGVGLPLYFFRVVAGRKIALIKSGALDEAWPNGERPTTSVTMAFASIPGPLWNRVLQLDQSMMVSLYDQFEFKYMCVQGTTLIFKLMVVCPAVFAAPNSLTQLSAAAAVECFQLLFAVITSAYQDHWLDMYCKVCSLAIIGLLSCMSFHRVAIYLDPTSDGYSTYMLYIIIFVILFTLVIIFKVVIVPNIVDWWRQRRDRKKMIAEADLEEIDDANPDEPDDNNPRV